MTKPPTSVNPLLVVVAALSSCTGSIAPPEPSSPQERPSGAGGNEPTTPEPPAVAPPAPEAPIDPGRVTLRRLNRAEYNNTVRDLLGTQLRPADGFASDPAGFGYDNNADVQSLSPLQLDQYLTAAGALAADALAGGVAQLSTRAGLPGCDPAVETDCQARLVKAFARRAFRRPVSDGEVGRLMQMGAVAKAQGDDPIGQLQLILSGILASPHFLFRVERDPDPTSLEPHPLAAHEMASRLSYFLWNSMPDAPLFDEADHDRLQTTEQLRAQATRMLADQRAVTSINSFTRQWLSLATLEQHEVDSAQFVFDRGIMLAARNETLLLFREFLAKDLPVAGLLQSPFSFLNDRLATHYGQPLLGTGMSTRVMLVGNQRPGILTHASILTRTSFPARTSPVVRGAWITTHLLCSPPPPPPANVPTLPEVPMGARTTARERLEVHRSNPACASCHALIDAIGFGLENYDLVGRYRTTDRGAPIDASGVLASGESFNGANELSALLAGDTRMASCLAQNLMTYALGRGLDPSDERSWTEVVKRAAGPAGIGVRSLVLEVVSSLPFRMRRGESNEPEGAKP
jgi:hypothetical protein